MRTQQTNSISLKKLTIARINLHAMHQIKGGSSLPTKVTNREECLIDD